MAEIAIGIATAGAEKIAGSLTEVFIQRFKDCYNLEENHEVLNQNVDRMEAKLRHVLTRFQVERRVLPDPAEKCITKMGYEVEKARDLRVRVDKRQSRCFECWNLCYPELSKECGEWKTKFRDLFRELDDEFHFLSDIEQILPAAGFVGSDIKSAEMQLQTWLAEPPQQLQRDLQILAHTEQIVSTAAPEAKPLLLQPVPDAGFVGLDIKHAEMQLQTWLAKPPHRVVGVWGMGGIGKTSLLKIIHNHFQKNSIAKALDLELFESFDYDLRRITLSASLEKKKFLLILDDAWEPIDFDEVGISFGNVDQGSKVLISTRSYQVIAAMGAQECSWKMQTLSEDEAWELFKGRAFINGPAALDRNIEAMARKIAMECKGLPLFVKVVGAAMTLKETEDDWGRALTLMRNKDPNFHMIIEERLYKQLRYCYNDLSDHNLQSCFLYCAAFREDEVIDAERLVEIWIAEGLLTGKETTYLMDVGHHYLDLLANRCLIEYVDNEEVKRIKIRDVLREVAIYIGESEEHWLFATDQHLTNFPGEKEISNCNRISLGHNDIQDLPTDLMKCPNLVSLLLPSNQKLSHVPQPFLSSVISLRVLDLSWTGITELPISVGELRLLEFLDLSNCRELIELPDNLGNLSALQFFNLDSCEKLKGLPSTIRGLKVKASHFRRMFRGTKVNSDDIGQLISLNRLVVGYDTAVRAGDLINLTKMRVLKATVTAGGGDVVTIDTWTEMKHLTLWFKSDGVNIQKIESVEKLELLGYGGVTLPHCQFRNLKVLNLWACTELRELPLRSFPMLTVLMLGRLLKLESLSRPSNVWNEGSMSKLQELTISGCPLLKKLPLGMRLPNLKVLNISSCDILKELDIGNGDFPMLEALRLVQLKELESIRGSSGVWNEEATSKLGRVVIWFCPLLRRLPRAMEKLFRLNKLDWKDGDESVVLSDLFSE